MFTNEFGQTVKADWVSLSTNVDDLSALGTTIVRSMIRSSDITLEVTSIEIDDEPYLCASIIGVTEEHFEKLQPAIGVEMRYFEDAKEYDAKDSSELMQRILKLIFGETVSYSFGVDNDVLIRMDFDEYIKRTHGI